MGGDQKAEGQDRGQRGFQGNVFTRRFSNEASQVKAPKRKFPSERFDGVVSAGFPTEGPKRKLPSERPQSKLWSQLTQTKSSKQIHTRIPNRKLATSEQGVFGNQGFELGPSQQFLTHNSHTNVPNAPKLMATCQVDKPVAVCKCRPPNGRPKYQVSKRSC